MDAFTSLPGVALPTFGPTQRSVFHVWPYFGWLMFRHPLECRSK